MNNGPEHQDICVIKIHLRKHIWERLQMASKKYGRKITDIVREALWMWLEDEGLLEDDDKKG